MQTVSEIRRAQMMPGAKNSTGSGQNFIAKNTSGLLKPGTPTSGGTGMDGSDMSGAPKGAQTMTAGNTPNKPQPPRSGNPNPTTWTPPKPPNTPAIPDPVQENASVADHVTDLLDKNNAYMQQAATQGTQAANRRGLLNSSMSVQATEAARINAALPIASQDAGQAHQTNMQSNELTVQQRMQQFDAQNQQYMQRVDAAFREQMASLDRDAQERIANLNVAASERQAAAQLAASYENAYSEILANIMNNPDIPADVRQQYIDHAGAVRDSNLNLVEQMYGVDLDWGAGSSVNTDISRNGAGGSAGTPAVGGAPPRPVPPKNVSPYSAEWAQYVKAVKEWEAQWGNTG